MHADGDEQRGSTKLCSFVVLQICLYRDGRAVRLDAAAGPDGIQLLPRVHEVLRRYFCLPIYGRHAHTDTHRRARAHTHTHQSTHTGMRAHTHRRARTHAHARKHAHRHACTHTLAHAYAHTRMHVHARAHAHAGPTCRSSTHAGPTDGSRRCVTPSRASGASRSAPSTPPGTRRSARTSGAAAPGRIARAALRIVGRVVGGWLQRAVSWWCYARIARERQRALAPLRGGGGGGGVAAAAPHGMVDGAAIARAYGRRFARRSEICDDSALDCGCACTGTRSAARPRRTLEVRRRRGGWAHPRCHICTGTRSPPPHLHRDWARVAHICTETGPTPAHICTGTGSANAPWRVCAALTGFTLRRDPCSAAAAQEVRSHDTPRCSSMWQEVRAARVRLVGGAAATASAILFQQVRQVRPGCNTCQTSCNCGDNVLRSCNKQGGSCNQRLRCTRPRDLRCRAHAQANVL
jgi:hypothetical protein